MQTKFIWVLALAAALLALPAAPGTAAASSPVPPECEASDLSTADQARCDFIARTPDICQRQDLSEDTRRWCEQMDAGADDELFGGCDSAQGCAITALEGLVSGFTGSAGSQLWGWLMGGGQSAGIGAISSELDTISSTLSTIETELGPNGAIVQALERLQCSETAGLISSEPATAINNWYSMYSNYLTDPQTFSLGEISLANTDVTTLYGWANGVIQGNANQAPLSVSAALNSLHDLGVPGVSTGAIHDCVKASGNPPASTTLDDRPYYAGNVAPLQQYFLALNTQAMIMLTEAYHIYAFGDCVTGHGGDGTNIPAACQSSASGNENISQVVISNICPASGGSRYCGSPITIYGTLGSKPSGQFLPFTYDEFNAGGAPYSTSDHIIRNGTLDGTTWLMVKSIETYNAAANANCGDPSTTLCGPTVGAPGFTMESFAVGPYGFGKGAGKGTWTGAHTDHFGYILDKAGFFGTDVTLGRFLCTMSATGGNTTDCTQPPPTNQNIPAASGLKGADGKGFYFPQTFEYVLTSNGNVLARLEFQCFMDGNLPGSIADQPICTQLKFNQIINLKETLEGLCMDVPLLPDGLEALQSVTGRTMGVVPNYYDAVYCVAQQGWRIEPGYAYPLLRAPDAWHWPVLDLATITCPNGEPATTNLNPAGVPTLCGDAFDVWFYTQVPPGPKQATAVADATLDRSDPNTNDGANPRLLLVGHQHRTVIGFDPDELQAFLDANPLASARLVLSSADTSVSAADVWLQATPLDGTFVEGNGNAAERGRGAGSGATWNCAEDFEIADFVEECVQDWPRRFGQGRGTTVKVPDGYTGKVSFDVTADLANGASAWVIQRLRGGHSAAFHAREGAELLGDPSLAPTLLLIPADEDEVTADAE